MRNKTIKPIMILITSGIVLLLIYLALPKVYINASTINLEVEAFDFYDPKVLFKDHIIDQPKLYIKTNLGWKEESMDAPLKVSESLTVKILEKSSLVQSSETTFDIKGIDTIPPIIKTESNLISLEGGHNIKNTLNFKVLDYRYGEYDYELLNPDLDFVGMDIGEFTYTIIAQDLANNEVKQDITIHVTPHVISNEEATSNEVWVTKARRFASDFVPELVDVPSKYNYPYTDRTFKLRPEAKDQYVKMVDTLYEETGLWILINNSYREYDTQEIIFNRYVARDGEKLANRYSARPGHSEHQSGLTMDVRTQALDYKDFKTTEQYLWVKENAHRFGYIIRYTQDKEDISLYMSEEWHLRYVGEELATYLYENNLSLDEYKIQNLN